MSAHSTSYSSSTPTDQESSRGRILIVEDNKAIAQAVQFLLKREGYATKWCEDESVYTLIREWKPDLILMDLKMPHLDGGEVTTTIKSDPDMQSIPVIVVTANPVTDESVEQMQANDLINKPFQIRRLLDRIQYWLDRSRGGSTAGSGGGGRRIGGLSAQTGAGIAPVIRRRPGSLDGDGSLSAG